MAERVRLAAHRKDGATFPVEISLSPVPTATEHYVLAVIRDANVARQRDDLADLARGVAAGQPQLASELLDRVVQHLFQVGFSLQAAADLPGETARERLCEAMDRLDEVIHEIRDYAFTAGETDDGPGRDRPGAS
jgi:signal transduction histidine kinase